MSFLNWVPSSTLTELCWTVWLQEEQAAKKADKHVTSQLRIHKKAQRYPIGKVSCPVRSPQVTYRHTCQIDMAKAQEMGLECYHMFSSAVVPLGDASQESLDTIKRSCMQDPQKVAPHAPAIQDYFSALGDRLLDQDQQQKRLDLIRCCG